MTCKTENDTALDNATLNDRFGRRITYLRLAVVDRCNLRCFYCMPKEGVEKLKREEILRLEEYVEVVREACDLGISKIRITGGEPLVRRGIVELVRAVREIPAVDSIGLTTNGFKLEQYASGLKQAGLSSVNVSLDSLHSGTYRCITRGGDVNVPLNGIRTAQEVGLPVKINVVLLDKTNIEELEAFLLFSKTNDVEVRFIEQMNPDKESPFVSEAEVIALLKGQHHMRPIPEKRPGSHVRRFECDGARIGFISPRSHSFCYGCDKLRLTPAGEMRACLLSDVSVDIREVLRRPHTARDLKRAIIRSARLKPEEGPWTTPLRMWKIGG